MNEIAELFDVLLVEDEPADANLIRLAMKESHIRCRLHHVTDGVEAMAFLRHDGQKNASAPCPALILLDINMPRMTGHEFLHLIKADKQLASIPVVILTTSHAERDVTAAYEEGAAGFITKPVDIEKFIEAIALLNNYWFALVQLPKRISL